MSKSTRRAGRGGRPSVPHPKTTITVRIDPRAIAELERRARREHATFTEYTRAILEASAGIPLDPAA